MDLPIDLTGPFLAVRIDGVINLSREEDEAMNQASRDLMHFAGWGVSVLAALFGGWWHRRRTKRNAELREVLRRPTE